MGASSPFGAIGRLFNSQDKADAWRESSLQYRDFTGAEQKSLYQPLADFYKGKLNSDPMDFLQGEFGSHLFNALLGPSLNDFMTRGIPGINGQFSGINGIFNTRRGQAITQGLGGLYANAMSQYVQAVPALQQMQYAPAQQALQFALTQTQGTTEQKAGSGNAALSGFGSSI